MDLIGPLCDLEIEVSKRSQKARFNTADLDRDMGLWYSELPETLKWTQPNIEKMPPSFFLLQYVLISSLHPTVVQC